MTASRRDRLPQARDRLELGRRGLVVSPVCVGMTRDPRTIPAAFEAGVNFFFVTADMHWPLYEATRRGLAMLLERPSVRDDVVVAVVSYATQPEFCWMPHKEVVDAIPGLERVDVTVAGGAYGSEILVRRAQYLEHLRRGFVGARAIGATFHDRNALVPSVNNGLFDVSFVRYNASHVGAREEVFPRLEAEPRSLLYNIKSTFGSVPHERYAELGLDEDHWRPRVVDHYRFVLGRPEMRGILCGPSTPAHVEELARALEEGPLDDEEEQFLVDLAALAEGRVELEGDDD